MEPAQSAEVTPIVALAYGGTEREAEVDRRVTHGLNVQEMAAKLFLSTYTVRDHFKPVPRQGGSLQQSRARGQALR